MHIEMSLHPKVKRSATQLFDMNFDKPYEGNAQQFTNKYLAEGWAGLPDWCQGAGVYPGKGGKG